MCESKVHACVNPSRSALRVNSMTRQAGGSGWKVTPKSMLFSLVLSDTRDGGLGARGKVDAAGYIALPAAKTGSTGEQLLEAEPDQVGDTYPLHDREGSCKGGQYSRDPDPRGSIHEGDGLDTRAGDETCESPPSTPRHSVVDSRDRHESNAGAATTKSMNEGVSGTGSLLSGPFRHFRGLAAADYRERQVSQPRDEEGKEQAVVVETLDKGGVLEDSLETWGRGGLEESRQDGDHADKDRYYRPPVPAAGVGVAAIPFVEVGQFEPPAAQNPVVCDHDGRDRPEQAPVADEPGEDVGADVLEENPGEGDDAQDRGDDTAGAERDVLRCQVGEVERGGDHVRSHVRRDLGDHYDDHGEDQSGGKITGDPRDHLHRVPDGLAEDHDGGRGDRDPDNAEGRHRYGEPQSLSDDLRLLALGVAGKVRDVEGERDPIPHVRRQGRPEKRPERCVALLQLRRGGKDGAHTAAGHETPREQGQAAGYE